MADTADGGDPRNEGSGGSKDEERGQHTPSGAPSPSPPSREPAGKSDDPDPGDRDTGEPEAADPAQPSPASDAQEPELSSAHEGPSSAEEPTEKSETTASPPGRHEAEAGGSQAGNAWDGEESADETTTPRTSEAEGGEEEEGKEDARAATPATERPAISDERSGASGRPDPSRQSGTSGTSPGSAPEKPPATASQKTVPPTPKSARPAGGGILMGRPFGVPVYVAPSWFLVAALITWVFGGQLDRVLPDLGSARYLIALFFAVAFYASVLVHELAHTVAALRFKLPVRRIQLQFFGGVSEIEKESETPGREFVLAFVGPLLSLALAAVFYGGMQVVEPRTVPGVLLAGLMISNLIVAVFNLLPGLPLDGGRMLRAVVWKLSGKPMTGTVAAAWTGRALAITVLIGLPLATYAGGRDSGGIGGMDSITDALLAAILAAIIWTGAGNSLRMARLREHLPSLRARTLTRRAVPVAAETPLSEGLRRANEAGARAMVVVDGKGDPMSLVREASIVGVPEHRRPWVAVSTLAQDIKEGMRVPAELAGEELLDHLRATPATEYLVVEETGEIYGVLSTSDVERAFVRAMAKRPNQSERKTS